MPRPSRKHLAIAAVVVLGLGIAGLLVRVEDGPPREAASQRDGRAASAGGARESRRASVPERPGPASAADALEGVVTADGEPVAGAAVYLFPTRLEQQGPSPCPESSGRALLEGRCVAGALEAIRRFGIGDLEADALDYAITDATGAFRFVASPGRVYSLVAEHAGRTASHARASTGRRVALELEGRVAISGRVVDGDRRAIAGAQVLAFVSTPLAAHRAQTDAQGRFRIEGLAPAPVLLVARADGFVPGVATGEPAREVDIALVAPRRVRALVLDEGRPADGAEVRLMPAGLVAHAGRDGRVVFDEAPCDPCRLEASRGARHAIVRVAGTGPELDVVLELEAAAAITVRLRAESPIPDPEVLVWDDTTYRGRPVQARDPVTFEARDLPPGEYVVSVRAPGFASTPRLEVTLGPAEERSLEFALTAGTTVRGRVRDTGGAPVADAALLATAARTEHGAGATRFGHADADGAFELRDLAPGPHRLSASADGFERHAIEVSAPAEGIELVLEAAAGLEGTVRFEDGEPVAGARVRAAPAPAPAPAPGPARTRASGQSHIERTSNDGNYRFEGLAPGTVALSVELEALVPATRTVEVRRGEVTRADFALSRGLSIEGLVVDASGAPVAGARVRAMPGLLGSWKDARSNADGRFVVGGLVPGRLALDASADGHAASPRVDAEAGALGVRIALGPRAGSVRGRVVGQDGAPIRQFAIDGESRRSADGAFERQLERLGPLVVSITGSFPEVRIDAEIASGRVTDLGDIVVAHGASISGRVLSPTGIASACSMSVRSTTGASGLVEVAADGSYRASRLPHARAIVRARCSEGWARAEVDVSSGDARRDLSLAEGGVLRVRGDGLPAGLALLAFGEGWTVDAVLGADSVAELRALPPGAWRLVASAASGESAAVADARVEPGRTTEVVLAPLAR